jgi:hypothetical protein
MYMAGSRTVIMFDSTTYGPLGGFVVLLLCSIITLNL